MSLTDPRWEGRTFEEQLELYAQYGVPMGSETMDLAYDEVYRLKRREYALVRALRWALFTLEQPDMNAAMQARYDECKALATGP